MGSERSREKDVGAVGGGGDYYMKFKGAELLHQGAHFESGACGVKMERMEIFVLLLSVACWLPHLYALETTPYESNESVETVAKIVSQVMQASQTEEEALSNVTGGIAEANPVVMETLEGNPLVRAIERRMDESEDEVTHGVGYGSHLDPHYYQRRDMGKYYDCALQGPWKPISGHNHQHEGNGQAEGDNSGQYHEEISHPHPQQRPQAEFQQHSQQRPIPHPHPHPHHHQHPHHHPHPHPHHRPHPRPHHHPHPHPAPHKQNNNGNNHNYVDDFVDHQVNNAYQDDRRPPMGGGRYRNVPSGAGHGGRGHNNYQNEGNHGGHDGGPSGQGQSSDQIIEHGNGQNQESVHLPSHIPTVFDPVKWHDWFFANDYGGPSGHDDEALSVDHQQLAAFHNSHENVGDGRYTEAVFGMRERPRGQKGQGNAPVEVDPQGHHQEGGRHGGHATSYSNQQLGDYPQGGHRPNAHVMMPYNEPSGEGEMVQESEEEAASEEEEEEGEAPQASGENKMPCQETEEEDSNATDESPSEDEARVPQKEDLTYMSVMYPPPPQHANEASGPGSDGEDTQQGNAYSEVDEEADEEPRGNEHQANGHAQPAVQHISGEGGQIPHKCPYAGHHPNAYVSNSLQGGSYEGGEHSGVPQVMLPPNHGWGKPPLPLPVKPYEVYENQEDGGNKENDGEGSQPPAYHHHEPEPTNYGGEGSPVYGQRIPPNQGVLQIYGKPVPYVAVNQYVPVGPVNTQEAISQDAVHHAEQQVGNTFLKPPPVLLRDTYVKGNSVKSIMEGRRKRRPFVLPTLSSGKFPGAPVKVQVPFMMRARRVVRRPTARRMLILS